MGERRRARPKSESKSARTRRRILDAGASAFRRDGYAAVKLKDIATLAGLQAGSLYYHFRSKEEIVEEVLPGVYLGNADCLKRVAETEEGQTARYRVFAGYSGWGPDQLESELAAGAWIIAPATADLVFDTSVDELWDHLSPPAIPRPSNN